MYFYISFLISNKTFKLQPSYVSILAKACWLIRCFLIVIIFPKYM